MIYNALKQFLQNTATAQAGIEDFFFDYGFEMNSPNFGKGGSTVKAFPAIFVEPPDGAFDDVKNTYPKGVKSTQKDLGLRFTIINPETMVGTDTGEGKQSRPEHLDTLETLLRDYVNELLNRANPALGGLFFQQIGKEIPVTFRPHQGNSNYLMVAMTLDVRVTVPCPGEDFDYSFPCSDLTYTEIFAFSGSYPVNEIIFRSSAKFEITTIEATNNSENPAVSVGGVSKVVGDTINLGDVVKVETERTSPYGTTQVTLAGLLKETTGLTLKSWQYGEWTDFVKFDAHSPDELAMVQSGLKYTHTSGAATAKLVGTLSNPCKVKWMASKNVWAGFMTTDTAPASFGDFAFSIRDGGTNVFCYNSTSSVYSEAREGGSVFMIEADGVDVNYYINEVLVHTESGGITADQDLFFYAYFTGGATHTNIEKVTFVNVAGFKDD